MSRFKEEFAKKQIADRRLTILKLLIEAEGEAGESALEWGLRQWGFQARLSREVVQEDLIALKKVHCVENEFGPGGYITASISRIGVRAANGEIEVEGVSKPQLGV